MKIGTNYVPLEATPTLYFLNHLSSNILR